MPQLTTDLSHERWKPFRCDVAPERGTVRVVPHGELDMATCPELERHLRELRDAGFDRVVLDLRELTFMDSSGLRAIIREDAAARAEGRTFSLVAGPPAVQRTFEVACVVERLPFIHPG